MTEKLTQRVLGVPELCYQNDNKFKYLVDMLESVLHQAEFTPSEVRSAAILACIHYEARNIKALRIRIGKDGQPEIGEFNLLRDHVDEAEARVRELKAFIEGHPLYEDSLERMRKNNEDDDG